MALMDLMIMMRITPLNPNADYFEENLSKMCRLPASSTDLNLALAWHNSRYCYCYCYCYCYIQHMVIIVTYITYKVPYENNLQGQPLLGLSPPNFPGDVLTSSSLWSHSPYEHYHHGQGHQHLHYHLNIEMFKTRTDSRPKLAKERIVCYIGQGQAAGHFDHCHHHHHHLISPSPSPFDDVAGMTLTEQETCWEHS